MGTGTREEGWQKSEWVLPCVLIPLLFLSVHLSVVGHLVCFQALDVGN